MFEPTREHQLALSLIRPPSEGWAATGREGDADPDWTPAEKALAARALAVESGDDRAIASDVAGGQDPLGDTFCRLRRADLRRPLGATYTPMRIVHEMVRHALSRGPFAAIIDPGAGSGRFLVAAGLACPGARLVGLEIDPLAAQLARANIAAARLNVRAEIRLCDYRSADLDGLPGPRLFIGNPPYVRHHLIGSRWKQWLVDRASTLSVRASRLAGLHAHFIVATACHARPGDVGVFITSAEWLDVNYGDLIRKLLTSHLGLRSVHLLDAEVEAFPDAATTAVVVAFRVGTAPMSVGVKRVVSMGDLDLDVCSDSLPIERLRRAARWSPLIRAETGSREGFVELGELCSVHRGQVTGANKVWIAGPHSRMVPERFLFRTVTKARDLFAAGAVLVDGNALRHVIDIPSDLDGLSAHERQSVEAFLHYAESLGTDGGYVARARRAWWSVGLRAPAPILATYMARRAPAFVVNAAGARHINVAHGVYPRVALSTGQLHSLAAYLSQNVTIGSGRTYAGGLTKFEPKEMERLLIPDPSQLSQDGEWLQVHA